MKALVSFFFVAAIPLIGMAQGQNQPASSNNIPERIKFDFTWIGLDPSKTDEFYKVLMKACKGLHDDTDTPHNAYAVKKGDCYVVAGSVIQQISKHEALMQVGDDDQKLFVGYFTDNSTLLKNGTAERVGYSPAEGAAVHGVAVGVDPYTYETTAGESKTVPAYIFMAYRSEGN